MTRTECGPPPGNVGAVAAGLLGAVRIWLDSGRTSENCSWPKVYHQNLAQPTVGVQVPPANPSLHTALHCVGFPPRLKVIFHLQDFLPGNPLPNVSNSILTPSTIKMQSPFPLL